MKKSLIQNHCIKKLLHFTLKQIPESLFTFFKLCVLEFIQ